MTLFIQRANRRDNLALHAKLDELLHRWEELRKRGESPTPEEICRDAPDLLPPFRREMDALLAAESELGGFGAVRARRGPLPVCKVEVDPCYSARGDAIGCINPEFYEVPAERPSFRVIAQVRR